jgi:hypothetical protein
VIAGNGKPVSGSVVDSWLRQNYRVQVPEDGPIGVQIMPKMIAARNPKATIAANAVNLAVISIGSLLSFGCGTPH